MRVAVTLAVALVSVPGALAASTVPAATESATAHQLQGCLAVLPAAERNLLASRFGLDGRTPKNPGTLGARLHLTAVAIAASEHRALTTMQRASARGTCPENVRTAVASSQRVSAAPTAAFDLGAGAPVPSWTSPRELIPLGIAAVAGLGLLIGLYREFRPQASRRLARGARSDSAPQPGGVGWAATPALPPAPIGRPALPPAGERAAATSTRRVA